MLQPKKHTENQKIEFIELVLLLKKYYKNG